MEIEHNDDQQSSSERLKLRIREEPLLVRLAKSRHMIANMCSSGRPPKMTIPVQFDDEDLYISTTLEDAEAVLGQVSTVVVE